MLAKISLSVVLLIVIALSWVAYQMFIIVNDDDDFYGGFH